MSDNNNERFAWLKGSWLKRSGIIVFMFFLIKGLVWVGLACAVWMGLSK